MYDRVNDERNHGLREFIWSYPLEKFKLLTRVTPNTFHYILERIKNHEVFRNDSRVKQRPIWIQLIVALSRFGTPENGASLRKIARIM